MKPPSEASHRMSGNNIHLKPDHRFMPFIGALSRSGMKRSTLTALTGAGLLILTSCGQPSMRVPSEAELVGRWILTELRSPKGNRGPAEGILQGQMVFNRDGSCSNFLQWTKEATGKELPPMTFTGSWMLSNQIMTLRGVGTNAAPSQVRVSFEGELLVVETAGSLGRSQP